MASCVCWAIIVYRKRILSCQNPLLLSLHLSICYHCLSLAHYILSKSPSIISSSLPLCPSLAYSVLSTFSAIILHLAIYLSPWPHTDPPSMYQGLLAPPFPRRRAGQTTSFLPALPLLCPASVVIATVGPREGGDAPCTYPTRLSLALWECPWVAR